MTRRFPATLLLALAAGCGSTHESDGPPPLLTELPRSLSGTESLIISANNQFGFDLLLELRKTGGAGNIFVSPLSAVMALGMAMNGAAGTTLDSMRLALRFGTVPMADINTSAKSLTALLLGLDSSSTFAIANSIWTRQGFDFLPAFLAACQDAFGATVQALDFGSPQAVPTINTWVSQQTAGRIPTILDQIDPAEVAFLINAIYFKGSWRLGFDPADTRSGPFTAADGTIQTVPMMHLDKRKHRVGGTSEAQILELLYGNGAWALDIVLPNPNRTLADITAGLTVTRWSEWLATIGERELPVSLPKFRLEYDRALMDDLSALGMRVAFDQTGRADFSGMAGQPGDLYLSRVTQKTFVEVNEEGTEAAAATLVGVGLTSAPLSFDVNRPFLFAIRERLSGTILFLGQVTRIPQ